MPSCWYPSLPPGLGSSGGWLPHLHVGSVPLQRPVCLPRGWGVGSFSQEGPQQLQGQICAEGRSRGPWGALRGCAASERRLELCGGSPPAPEHLQKGKASNRSPPGWDHPAACWGGGASCAEHGAPAACLQQDPG